MNRAQSILFKALLVAAPIGAALTVGAPSVAEAQVVVLAPRPPAAFIVSAQPEYYQGRPAYYYHSNWYYHDGHGWNYYHGEPAYLRDRRAHWGGEHRGGGHYHYRR